MCGSILPEQVQWPRPDNGWAAAHLRSGTDILIRHRDPVASWSGAALYLNAQTEKWTLFTQEQRDGDGVSGVNPPPPTHITSCVVALRAAASHLHRWSSKGKKKKKRGKKKKERRRRRAAAFRRLQLHPLKENDVPLEVGVCLAGWEMADLGRVIDWKSGVCHSTLVLRGVIHSRLLQRSICCLREVIKNRMLRQLPYKQEIRLW